MKDFEINYGLIAIKRIGHEVEVVHFCGYEVEPVETDINHLREELSQDMSFGLTEIIDELEIVLAPAEILKHYKKIFESNDCEITENEEKI